MLCGLRVVTLARGARFDPYRSRGSLFRGITHVLNRKGETTRCKRHNRLQARGISHSSGLRTVLLGYFGTLHLTGIHGLLVDDLLKCTVVTDSRNFNRMTCGISAKLLELTATMLKVLVPNIFGRDQTYIMGGCGKG